MRRVRRASKSFDHGLARPVDGVGGHHPGDRAERHAVAGKARGDEPPGRDDADVREAIARLDDLAGPAMHDAHVRHQFTHPSLERREAAASVVGLAGLVVLAAEDDVLIAVTGVDSKIVVGARGVFPEQPFRHRALGHPSVDGVGRIRKQVGLQQRRL